jgi:hypothetical protein
VLLALLIACAGEEEPSGCADWPSDPVAPDGVLRADEDCGFWTIAVDEHLYVDLVITVPLAECPSTLGDGIELFSTPIYSAMSNDEPKLTFDVVGAAPTGSEYALFDVLCEEGSRFSARIDVE